MPETPRTSKQNNSLHGTLREYAEKLNDAGFDYTIFIQEASKKGFKAAWTESNVKELFNVVSKAMNDGKTSSELSTKEMIDTYQVFERHMAEQSGISNAWHSREQQMLSSDNRWWGDEKT